MSKILKNHKLVIIGGSGALGGKFLDAAIVQGAICVVIDRNDPMKNVPFFTADITSLAELTDASDKAFAKLGGLDTVVNFAGTHHQPMDFCKDDPSVLLSEYCRVMEVNLTGAFLATMIFSKRMVARRHGHIIHLCSNATRLALYGSYAYNISKHGLEGLIKTAAAQLAPFGVRINGIAPGTVETPLNRGLLRSGEQGGYSLRATTILAHTPTKRFATLEGITETIIATCIPQRHLTGNVIFCDDGYNIEGHSWPLGNAALYGGSEKLEELYARLEREYPFEK
jgi:NAD(P)-dependent dehydrogenase (short-subunit alcohol dehydrogenase family)